MPNHAAARDETTQVTRAARLLGQRSTGGRTYSDSLTPEQRAERARTAVGARWVRWRRAADVALLNELAEALRGPIGYLAIPPLVKNKRRREAALRLAAARRVSVVETRDGGMRVFPSKVRPGG